MLKTKPVLYVYEGDWSTLVSETYGRPYQLQQSGYGEPLGQDTLIDFKVPTILDEGEQEIFEAWRDQDASPPEVDGTLRNFHYELNWQRGEGGITVPFVLAIANDLHARGLMEAGEYVIHVWW